ncbi:MAG: LptF/LptG family permease [Phenylobacterium sp.]|jgi:lipopolysaccharide export system permease protein|uniref:LptF/LptG family permease n=1 Tax=Phenylobacterium sp. TaxID=1871053 RepID=UPI0025D03D1A|nr:LptF/LptG family permease [Phenylobacterium sp.]MCA3711374.1 LptF/LptG family permease [Phenylobacterium sp.]MCA3716576.1 LptF/LptG family permease [Phenylobacterium sp.]MCA3722606.1 LptF/LptG family permease [Phenylobacterium sp.]MCA3725174.1 LptF/LptG family permease [Phenylobacterium sp.]MCA3737744.1 LptF/LptG family permease [Phenylobacterium sp.]
MTRFFSILDLYLLRSATRAVAGAFAIISAVILLIQFEELSRSVGVRTDAAVSDVLWLTLLRSPSLILLLSPFMFLFGGIAAYVSLNRSSELTAMRAAGVSAWRFIAPSAVLAFTAGVFVVTVLNPLAASLSARFEVERARLMQNYLADAPKEVWLRQGDDRGLIVIHAKSRDLQENAIRLRAVSMFVYQKDPEGRLQFRRRIEAAEAVLRAGLWNLRDVREAAPGQSAVRSDSLSIRSALTADGAVERFASPEAVTFWGLPAAIRQTEMAGFSARAFQLRLHQLMATPVLFAAMAILAATSSLRLTRQGGLALAVGVGTAIGFLVFFFNQMTGALASADIIPPLLGAWAPPLVALLSGLAVLCYTEDG